MLFDTHTHVQFEEYDADREEVMARAREEGVWMLNVGTNLAYSQKAIALAHTCLEGVYASVGLHPNDVASHLDFAPFEELARDPKVVAIGETGLDYSRIRNQESGMRNQESEIKKMQRDLFIKHIELSQRIRKPLVIHCRDAHDDLLSILHSYFKIPHSARGVMHFFGGAGSWENAKAYLEMGLYLSFSGVVTFAHYAHGEDLKSIPLDSILVETDAPFAAPVPQRGKRNEPSFVRWTAEKIAELKNVSFEKVAERTGENAKALFGV